MGVRASDPLDGGVLGRGDLGAGGRMESKLQRCIHIRRHGEDRRDVGLGILIHSKMQTLSHVPSEESLWRRYGDDQALS
jgi:hypothetical protein